MGKFAIFDGYICKNRSAITALAKQFTKITLLLYKFDNQLPTILIHKLIVEYAKLSPTLLYTQL
jgi:hypothetical protein